MTLSSIKQWLSTTRPKTRPTCTIEPCLLTMAAVVMFSSQSFYVIQLSPTLQEVHPIWVTVTFLNGLSPSLSCSVRFDSNKVFVPWSLSIMNPGKHLPKPKLRLDRLSTHIRPFVKVRILGHPDDEDNTGETDVIERNWRNPIWGGRHNTFQFHVKVSTVQ